MHDPMPTEKCCTKCGEVKPHSAFNKNKNRSDGLHAHCKVCRASYYDANAEAIRAYSRAYHAENIEASRQACHAWYVANRLVKRVYDLAYRAANRQARLAYKRAYYAANAESLCAASRAWRAANPGYARRWRAANPDMYRARANRRHALIKGSEGSFSKADLTLMRMTQGDICAYCCYQYDAHTLTIDHIIPVAQGGSHDAANICLACRKCNFNKHNKTPDQWLRRWYYSDPKTDEYSIEIFGRIDVD